MWTREEAVRELGWRLEGTASKLWNIQILRGPVEETDTTKEEGVGELEGKPECEYPKSQEEKRKRKWSEASNAPGGASIMMTFMEVIDDFDKSSLGAVEKTEDWFQPLTYLLW